MKKCAIACSAIFFLSFHASAQTYLNCNFSQGIPADFTLIDNDGNTPSADMAKEGFKVGTPWLAASPKGESNLAACSTSWYSPAGTSDDWMITPAFTVSDDNVTLSWRALASDKRNRDGYAVYVSEVGGNTIADFDKQHPLFSVEKEEATWTKHAVSLDAYKGKKISIAFVNNSNNKSRLYIDDLFAGVHSDILCQLTTAKGVPSLGDATITGIAYTDEDKTIDGFDVTLSHDGESYTEHFADQVDKNTPVNFSLSHKINLQKYKPVDYSVKVSAGNQHYTANSTITAYQRKVICEEGTGTWCGYCVRGLVYVDSLKEYAKDWAIPIAAHESDPMENDYANHLESYWGNGGFPAGVINRKQIADPSKFFTVGKKMLSRENVLVDIDLQAKLDESTRSVTSTTTLHFAATNRSANYALAYAVIENNVHQPGNDAYRQHNSYANGKEGPMGGYEKYGEYIPSEVMYYQCVARGFVDDFEGIDGSVPSDYQADEALEYKKDFTLPDGILDDKNTALVVMLIDKSDKHVVNAQIAPLGANEVTGIRNIVNVSTSSKGKPAYYNASGMRIDRIEKGLNIIRQGDGTVIKIVH